MRTHPPLPADPSSAQRARAGNAQWLAQALTDSRRDTLETFAAFEAACPTLQVPQRDELNPPLWELGHVGWFQERWIARNQQRTLGWRADPQWPRAPARRQTADTLYDSSRVPHANRWSLPLPDAQQTRADLATQLEQTLACLAHASASHRDLYFFRLALLHEDMHHEASLYMARCLDVSVEDERWHCPVLPDPGPALALPATWHAMGSDPGLGFAFDNECGLREAAVGATEIDAQVLRWREFLPFAQDGGYEDTRWWTDAGWQWRARLSHAGAPPAPRYLRYGGSQWLQWRARDWRALNLDEPACHLSQHEAQAWCRWAGRRLPTEAEWEWAALNAGEDFRWGQVWEWTASAFEPFPGFSPHPYRDYSLPWFDGRPVLRGASWMTQPRMRHPRYRNFFTPTRTDIPAGFRSCAAG